MQAESSTNCSPVDHHFSSSLSQPVAAAHQATNEWRPQQYYGQQQQQQQQQQLLQQNQIEAEESSVAGSTASSDIDAATACTEELIVQKMYAANHGGSPHLGETTNDMQRSKNEGVAAGTGILLSDEATAILLEDKRRQRDQQHVQEEALKKQHASRQSTYSTSGGGAYNLYADDSSLSTAPDPPSLAERRHYSQPGAFPMTSMTGVPLAAGDGDNTDTPTSSIRGDLMLPENAIEATLVTEQNPNHPHFSSQIVVGSDDDCEIALPLSAGLHFAVSMGEITLATTPSNFVKAEPVTEGHTIRMFFRNKKVQGGILVLVAVFCLLVVGTIYGVTGFGKDDDDLGNTTSRPQPAANATPEPSTLVPTSSPTTPGDLQLEFFVKSALPEYSQEEIERAGSAQSKALAWLQNNTNLATYPLARRIQRFALATFYFATSGEERWSNTTGWLSDQDECEWFTTFSSEESFSSICDRKEGLYTRLALDRNGLKGTFPKEIGLLTSLIFLELRGNIVTGFLPSTLGDLTHLRELRLCKIF
jgi:hypothetical protein